MTDFNVLEKYLGIDTHTYHDNLLETLNYYIERYVLNVPFENINVQNGQPIALDNPSMIDKIVNEHRGGYCYEQNRLFCAFLTSKGYNVYMVSATIYNGSGWAMEGSHMALIVTLNQKKYLVDVGYADIPKAAMPITNDEEIVYDVNSEFKVSKVSDHTFEMKKKVDHKWQTQYQFEYEPKVLADFEQGIAFNQNNEASIFVQQLLISKATTFGRVTMSNNHLTITDHGQKEKKNITSGNYKYFLYRYFGIKDINIKTFD
ncbi:arylamine N-acetyltransferase family protein [Staphylococcus cohnii]